MVLLICQYMYVKNKMLKSKPQRLQISFPFTKFACILIFSFLQLIYITYKMHVIETALLISLTLINYRLWTKTTLWSTCLTNCMLPSKPVRKMCSFLPIIIEQLTSMMRICFWVWGDSPPKDPSLGFLWL